MKFHCLRLIVFFKKVVWLLLFVFSCCFYFSFKLFVRRVIRILWRFLHMFAWFQVWCHSWNMWRVWCSRVQASKWNWGLHELPWPFDVDTNESRQCIRMSLFKWHARIWWCMFLSSWERNYWFCVWPMPWKVVQAWLRVARLFFMLGHWCEF